MKYFGLVLIASLFMLSCENDDDSQVDVPIVVELSEEVEAYVSEKVENSLVLGIQNGENEAFLVDKTGKKIKEWTFDLNLGNDLELLPDGRLLGIFKPADRPEFSFGGYGGIIQILNIDGTVDWEFVYQSDDFLAHHDVEMLPNGNVLFLAWERIKASESIELGIDVDYDVFSEALIEVNPNTNEIEWEWHSKDHLVQDINNTLPSFGEIDQNPQLINHNYVVKENGDIIHANGIDYDVEKDVIYVSVNFFSEVWVIDHSTTTAEAASHNGGQYEKGGDLIYRFGNPEAYNNASGERLFHNNHFPNYLNFDEPGAGNMLVYMNGNSDEEQSIVYELKIPQLFHLLPNTNNEPEIIWSFTNVDLYNRIVSGAVRLKNGNTLICEGDYGFWEVTPENEIVWKYNGTMKFWRAYSYLPTDAAILNLDL